MTGSPLPPLDNPVRRVRRRQIGSQLIGFARSVWGATVNHGHALLLNINSALGGDIDGVAASPGQEVMIGGQNGVARGGGSSDCGRRPKPGNRRPGPERRKDRLRRSRWSSQPDPGRRGHPAQRRAERGLRSVRRRPGSRQPGLGSSSSGDSSPSESAADPTTTLRVPCGGTLHRR